MKTKRSIAILSATHAGGNRYQIVTVGTHSPPHRIIIAYDELHAYQRVQQWIDTGVWPAVPKELA